MQFTVKTEPMAGAAKPLAASGKDAEIKELVFQAAMLLTENNEPLKQELIDLLNGKKAEDPPMLVS